MIDSLTYWLIIEMEFQYFSSHNNFTVKFMQQCWYVNLFSHFIIWILIHLDRSTMQQYKNLMFLTAPSLFVSSGKDFQEDFCMCRWWLVRVLWMRSMVSCSTPGLLDSKILAKCSFALRKYPTGHTHSWCNIRISLTMWLVLVK